MSRDSKVAAHLRGAIRKLTGAAPRSSDPTYLRSRLATLLARKAKGYSVKARGTALVVPVSIGLPLVAAKALKRVSQNCGKSSSFIAKEALGQWMRAAGYHVEAAAFAQDPTHP